MIKTITIKNSWTDITIEQYIALQLCETNIDLIEILTSLDTLENVSEEDIADIVSNFSFLSKKPIGLAKTEYTINDIIYTAPLTPDKITTAQYIDLQRYIANAESSIHNILAVMWIPKGHKYNDGYDITAMTNDIFKNINIEDAYGYFFALQNEVAKLTKDYAGIFGGADEDDDEFTNVTDEVTEVTPEDEFNAKWGWIYLVEQISKLKNCSMDSIFEISILEFLNWASYLKEKSQYEQRRVERFKQQT